MKQQDKPIHLTENTTLAEFFAIILGMLMNNAENGPVPKQHHYPFAICTGRNNSRDTYIRTSLVTTDGNSLLDEIHVYDNSEIQQADIVLDTIAHMNKIINLRAEIDRKEAQQ